MSKQFINDMLKNYKERRPARFHMPGHKGRVNPLDVTEINMTDDLNNPQTYIMQAQRALSESYNSAESFFLVNGSTGGIHTMLQYVAAKSDYPILISRNAHKSIISGCMFFNIQTIVADEVFDEEQQVFLHNQQKIIDYISSTKLSAVVMTSVDYFGRVMDLSEISKACRRNNVLLLCDEAHGAHFHITPMLPDSALKYTDICVHSPHKTLSAMTQCSYIHISEKIDTAKFRSLMYSMQTSSPSFLLMKSMDDARHYGDIMKRQWEKRIEQTGKLESRLNSITGIKVMDNHWAENTGYSWKDPTRLVIDVSRIGSGIEISKILEDKHNVFMEMATFKYIVAILTPWDRKKWDRMLYKALSKIAELKLNKYKIPQYPQKRVEYTGLINTEKLEWERVSIKKAQNKTAAQSIGAYPPGVPLVLPGEEISTETIKYMQQIERLRGSLFGVENGYIYCIKKEH